MTRWLALACAVLAGCTDAPVTARFAAASSPHVLFVQLAGEVLQGASADDATTDHSGAASGAPSGVAYVPPFDPTLVAPGVAAADVEDVLFDRLRTAFAPWDVTLTRTRPSSGAYTLIAVGGSSAIIGADDGVAGLAFGVDCTDANPSNVVYDFSDEQSPDFGGVVSAANTAAHEAGHAFGLEHTDDPHDLMYEVASPTQAVPDVFGLTFRETGSYSSYGAGGLSQPESCGRANPVNAGVLTAHLGASSRADTTAPSLTVTAPAAGTDVSTTAQVEASATDDVGVVRLEVYQNFALVAVASGPTLSTQVSAGDGQTYYLTVDAIDAAANRATVTRLVTAHAPADLSPPPDAGAADGAAVDAGTAPVPSGGCAFAPAPPASPLALLLVAMGWWRAATYRRSRRATRC